MSVTISCWYCIAFEVMLLFLVLIWRRLTDILEFFSKKTWMEWKWISQWKASYTDVLKVKGRELQILGIFRTQIFRDHNLRTKCVIVTR